MNNQSAYSELFGANKSLHKPISLFIAYKRKKPG